MGDQGWAHKSSAREEQGRKGCEQISESEGQEKRVDPGMQSGTRGSQDQGLQRVQEGDGLLRQGKGALQKVSRSRQATLDKRAVGRTPNVGISMFVELVPPFFFVQAHM